MLKLPKDKIIKFKIYDIPMPIPFKLLVVYKITLPISSYYQMAFSLLAKLLLSSSVCCTQVNLSSTVMPSSRVVVTHLRIESPRRTGARGPCTVLLHIRITSLFLGWQDKQLFKHYL